jgi:hypothetical protein
MRAADARQGRHAAVPDEETDNGRIVDRVDIAASLDDRL